MKTPITTSLALGYLPVLCICTLLWALFGVPLWVALLGVFLGGPVLTLAIAALRGGSELGVRLGWRRARRNGDPDAGGSGRAKDSSNTR